MATKDQGLCKFIHILNTWIFALERAWKLLVIMKLFSIFQGSSKSPTIWKWLLSKAGFLWKVGFNTLICAPLSIKSYFTSMLSVTISFEMQMLSMLEENLSLQLLVSSNRILRVEENLKRISSWTPNFRYVLRVSSPSWGKNWGNHAMDC